MTGFQTPRAGDRPLSVVEAQRLTLAAVQILGTERVALTEVPGRVLREDIFAPRDIPERDNSAMDGYAVRAADLESASHETPVALDVIEDVPAGKVATQSVSKGTAIRIMTGALLPEGADVVVPVELTDAGSQRVLVHGSQKRGLNIRQQGEDMRTGDAVLRAGTVLRAAEAGVLASVRRAIVSVGRRPVVAVLSTGDEVVDLDGELAPGRVANSNAYSLSALILETGAIPRMIGIVPDTKEATVAAIENALESDVILSTGGVSVGAFDFVKDALDDLGAETHVWQVAMKPGKPVVVSTVRERLYFGLPGNPVSCMVGFHLFVAPALRKMMGETGNVLPPVVATRLEGTLRSRGERPSYLRVRVIARDGELVSIPMPAQGSGVSTSMVRAAGLAIVEGGATIESGSLVPTVLIGPIESI